MFFRVCCLVFVFLRVCFLGFRVVYPGSPVARIDASSDLTSFVVFSRAVPGLSHVLELGRLITGLRTGSGLRVRTSYVNP